LSVPPPTLGAAGGGGTTGAVVLTMSTVVFVIVCPASAAVSTEFGSFTIACVILGGIGFGSRKGVAMAHARILCA
jgi:TRAP-type C4-dicarboxylate transport system permease small subunit